MGILVKMLYSFVICSRILLLCGAASLAMAVHGAIPVGTNGTGVLAFDTLPLVTEWSTASIFGVSTTITTAEALDAAVQTNAAATITNLLMSNSVSPVTVGRLAQWSSAGHSIQTRPNSVAATLLMATFQNLTGTNVSSLRVTYDLDTVLVTTLDEFGQRVFFSFSGATNSWQFINQFTNAGHITFDLLLGSWTNQGTLYLLWVDDNSLGAPDNPWIIDNFSADPPPVLNVTRVGSDQIEIYWPFPSEGYALNSRDDLNASTWNVVTNEDRPLGGFHRVSVDASKTTQMFRLEKP